MESDSRIGLYTYCLHVQIHNRIRYKFKSHDYRLNSGPTYTLNIVQLNINFGIFSVCYSCRVIERVNSFSFNCTLFLAFFFFFFSLGTTMLRFDMFIEHYGAFDFVAIGIHWGKYFDGCFSSFISFHLHFLLDAVEEELFLSILETHNINEILFVPSWDIQMNYSLFIVYTLGWVVNVNKLKIKIMFFRSFVFHKIDRQRKKKRFMILVLHKINHDTKV